MADTQEQAKVQEELKRDQNWAEMESDEDEQNEEIGVQGSQESGATGTTDGAATEEGVRKKKHHKRHHEDKKEEKKQYAQQQRTKTNRGDYVVTSFVIPERTAVQEKKVTPNDLKN